ncbi:MAG: protein-glutamate O-methyltransferase CheR [Kangiellaceae bacterium]|nr:protein-glutamate O-methyltransferase CheR [Kangiellaceae bacterium]
MQISANNYQYVRDRLKQRTGVELGDKRQTLVASRLNRRLTKLGISAVDQYIERLKNLPASDPEWILFVDLLTTHETYFFREGQHYDFLKQVIFPGFKQLKLDILSAACSTGEEAYSIAMECSEYFGNKDNWSIYASDISNGSIECAKKGLYSMGRAKLIPEVYLKKYMLKGQDKFDGLCLVKDTLKQRINFYIDNILESKSSKTFDVIFCRNLLIYFDDETKQKLINQLFQSLNKNGYLIISHSERLRGFLPNNVLVSNSIARRDNE